MAIGSFQSSAGGGGGGLHFRSPVDVFADAAARTVAFGVGGALAGEHTQFANDRSLAILIGTISSPTTFLTYTGGIGAYDDAAWLARTDAVRGPTGIDGPTGADGSMGADGAAGAVGADGSRGAVGADGPIGADGARGADGAMGAGGSRGAVGADGFRGAVGADGPIGADGARGADGTPGTDGAAGLTLHSGAPVPASALGANGDWYLRTANGGMYFKAGGAWSLIYTDQIGQVGSGITESAARTLIQTALAAAVTGNTETGIVVTYNSDGTIDFVTSAAPAPRVYARRSAISLDETLSQTEYNGGSAFTAQDITMPMWSGGRRWLFIGVPEAEGDITGVTSGGIDIFHAFVRVSGVLFAHKWWRTVDSQNDLASGVTYQIREA